jgi:hypothetical protein
LNLNNASGLYVGQICESAYFTIVTGAAPVNPVSTYKLNVSFGNGGLASLIFDPFLSTNYLIFVDNAFHQPAAVECDVPKANRVSLDMGECNGQNKTYNIPSSVVTAQKYIEIHPNASLTILGSGMSGAHFFINDCGGPFFKPPTPDSTSERSITIDDVVIERDKRVTDDDISIYPNPFTNEINVQCQIQGEELVDFSINLYDYSGKLIKNLDRKNKVNPGLYDLKTDLSSLPSGIYFYSLEVQGRSNIVKKSVKI